MELRNPLVSPRRIAAVRLSAASAGRLRNPPAKGPVARDPTRKLSYVSCVGNYRSIKMGLVYPFESLGELEAMTLLDVDPAVASFGSQPETFRWKDGRRRLSYTPDLLVAPHDGPPEYREVKPTARAKKDPDLGGRRPRIEQECAARGARFRFWTYGEIRAGRRLANAKLIVSGYFHLSGIDAFQRIDAVRHAVSCLGLPASIGAVLAVAGMGRQAQGTILGLVAVGELAMDLDAPFSDASVLRPGLGRAAVA